MDTKPYVGNIGVNIVVDLGEDVSTSTVRLFKVKKPNGTVVSWVPSVHSIGGKSNYLKYTTILNDLDQAGTYYLQPYLEFPTWLGYGETTKFLVYSLFN